MDLPDILPIDFCNNRHGDEKLWGRICEVKKAKDLEEVVVGYESMGPYAESLLYFAAINVVRPGRIMHERYQRYLQRGKPRVMAVITKLLGVIFALVRDGSEYVMNYEEIRLKKVA